MLCLKRIEGRTYNPALQPEKVLLKPSVTRFGRSNEHSDVVLDSSVSPRMISRLHAEIHFDDGQFRLDCKGMNGVLINQTRRSSMVLQDGDEVVFGGAGVKTKEGQLVPSPDSELVYVFSECCPDVQEEEGSLGEGTSDGRVRHSKRKEPIPGDQSSVPPGKKSKLTDDKNKETGDNEVNVVEPKKEDSKEGRKSKKWLDDLNEELLCCICRELMVLAHTLPCSHAFCYSCIRDWLGQSSDCPNCRADARLKSAVPVKALDNAIDRVAEEVLSPEEMEERKQKIQEMLNAKREAKEATRDSPEVSDMNSSDNSDASTNSEEEPEDEYFYSVEHARSGRSQCRTCSSLIENRALRWGVRFRLADEYRYEQTYYHHLDCFQPPHEITLDMVTISETLSRAEKNRVQARMRGH